MAAVPSSSALAAGQHRPRPTPVSTSTGTSPRSPSPTAGSAGGRRPTRRTSIINPRIHHILLQDTLKEDDEINLYQHLSTIIPAPYDPLPDSRVLLNTTPGAPGVLDTYDLLLLQQPPKVRGGPHYTLKQNTMVTNGTLEVSSLQR